MTQISLAVITRKNHLSLRRLLQSVKPVKFDEIVILETNGGDPQVEEVCKQFGARYETYIDPNQKDFEKFCDSKNLGKPEHFSDFAAARNHLFSLCSHEWVCWLDSDDVLRHSTNFRKILDKIEADKKAGAQLYYLYEKDAEGNVTTEQWRERIVRKSEGSWDPFLHEIFYSKEKPLDFVTVPKDLILVEHLKERETAPFTDLRNYRILSYHLSKNGDLDSRLWKKLGKTCRGLGRYQDACFAFEKHVETSNWAMDQFFSLIEIGICLRAMGLVKEATGYDARAFLIGPQYPQAYAGIAKDLVLSNQFSEALAVAETGIARLEMKECDTSHIEYNPTGTATMLYWAQYRCLYELSRHTESLAPLKKLIQLHPKAEEYRTAAQLTRKALSEAELGKAVATVFGSLVEEEDDEKLSAMAKAVPKEVLDLRPYQFLKRKTPPQGDGSKPSLAIICPGSNPRFGPSSLKEGIGGSEEAVIHMAPALARAGFYVDVFHDTLEEGEHGEGDSKHRWYPFHALKKNQIYDHVIAWRHPGLLEQRYHARTHSIWLHDVPSEIWSKKAIENLDHAIVLSKFHRSKVPWIQEEKIIYSRNGLSPDYFVEPKNDPKKVIYASNPTRGLKELLQIWSKIYMKTGAELHLFYGFTDWHRKMVAYSPHEQKYMLEVKNLYEENRKFKVFDHGMVGHAELADWFSQCGIWAYPTQFEEVSCITAMKAQAMGAIPMITNYAALQETVQFGEIVDWKVGTKYPLGDYCDRLIDMIRFPESLEEMRSAMVPWARSNFLWQPVADQWFKALEFGNKEELCFPAQHSPSKSLTLT